VLEDYDIVIVGGGMTGATLTCALAATHYRVALLEAHPFGIVDQSSYDDRGVALAFGSRRILDGLGLWSAIAPSATPIKTIHVSERGRFGVTRLDHHEERVEALGYIVRNREIGRALYAQLANQHNVEVIAPARLQDIVIGASHAIITINRVGKGATQHQNLRCRLLVAADGTDSAVRRRLGIGATVFDYAQTAIVANVTPSRHHAYTAFERFTATGPLALLPLNEGRCSLVWTHSSEGTEAALRLDDARFLANLQIQFGHRLGRFIKIGARSAYPLSLLNARELIKPRVAVIGNAAHTLHPVAGQGFNLALRDVAQLAELLCAAKLGDPGERALLRHYVTLRRADLRRTTRFTDGLARLFINPLEPLARARACALLTLDLVPPLRHILARRTMGLSGRIPRLTSGVRLADIR
jgi:2-octaprenyl-6-methoxyphenol hydroxylase